MSEPGRLTINDALARWAKGEGELPVFSGPPFPCRGCGEHPVDRWRAICAECVARATDRDRAAGLRAAWASVPATLTKLNFDNVAESVAGAPPRVTDAAAVTAARTAATARRPIVTLLGEPGAGKTSLAACILREWVRAGAMRDAPSSVVATARGARFVVAGELLASVSDHPMGRGMAPALAAAHRATVLVLDELQSDGPRDTPLFGLLHRRCADGKPTIVTTGFSREKLAEIYGGGIDQRLFVYSVLIEVRKAAQ